MHAVAAGTRGRRGFFWGLVALYLGLGSACSDTSSGASDPNGGAPGTFRGVYAMLFPTMTNARCNFCHSMPPTDVSNGHLYMGNDQGAAFAALVGQTSVSAKCMGRPLVLANHPESSLFFEKLAGSPPCGDRMPLGGAALSATQLRMIESWIANGANND